MLDYQRVQQIVAETFINAFISLLGMPHHISLSEEMGIHWTEDQPVTRQVRQQMEKDGVIKDLVGRLVSNKNSPESRHCGRYRDLSGFERDYLCLLTRVPEEYRYEGSHDFVVLIKPDIRAHPWDAIGNVYVGKIPDWLKESMQ